MKSFGKNESPTSSHLQVLYHKTFVQETMLKKCPLQGSRLRFICSSMLVMLCADFSCMTKTVLTNTKQSALANHFTLFSLIDLKKDLTVRRFCHIKYEGLHNLTNVAVRSLMVEISFKVFLILQDNFCALHLRLCNG